jgi:predicted nucleic acid-binding protein
VAQEIAARGANDVTARAISDTTWIEIAPGLAVSDDIASWGLGPGESSVLAIAQANPGMTAIVDDLDARKCAARLGIPVRGTLGIVLTAKRRGGIPLARPVLEELIASGLYLHRRVLDEALKRVDE